MIYIALSSVILWRHIIVFKEIWYFKLILFNSFDDHHNWFFHYNIRLNEELVSLLIYDENVLFFDA